MSRACHLALVTTCCFYRATLDELDELDLWRYDASTHETRQLTDGDFRLAATRFGSATLDLGERVVMLVQGPRDSEFRNSTELWAWEASDESMTRLLPDVLEDSGLTSSEDGALVFARDAAAGGQALYLTDGTAGGTFALTPTNHSSVPFSFFDLIITPIEGRAYFFPGSRNDDVWFTDGTVGGTRLVVEEVDGLDLLPWEVNGGLVFPAGRPAQLWFSPGDTTDSGPIDQRARRVRIGKVTGGC